MKPFREFLNEKNKMVESPQMMKGDAPFEDEEVKDRISDISKRGIEKDYTLVKKNLVKKLDLYKHNTNHYYVLGTWYYDDKEAEKYTKPRFAIITDLSCNVEQKFRSKQKQLKHKKVLSISTIHTTKNWRYNGISKALYTYMVQSGYIIISDGIQYEGAVNLWKKFPHEDTLVVHVYDSLEDKIISKFTSKTPDSHVWSDDFSKRRIKLVLSKQSDMYK